MTKEIMSPQSDVVVVGIGASAGGLAALRSLFSISIKVDVAFVIVQHLDPDHKSLLSELIANSTTMDVFEAKDSMPIEANSIYIIPPKFGMALSNNTLKLIEPLEPRGHRMPIDYFFRSLAKEKHERAVAIVLSGTGHDGTEGAKIIKSEGGMVIAQTPKSAEYDEMPQSIINTGIVDFELLPEVMLEKISSYTRSLQEINKQDDTTKNRTILENIFTLLHTQTTHDFSVYKSNTINRRMERRMAVHQISSLQGYYEYLKENKTEVEALFRDLLIGVTSFFRDPEAFDSLARDSIKPLVENSKNRETLRVWVPACSSGEEAYSIAILFMEALKAAKSTLNIQIFATDIDANAIEKARKGVYSESISETVSPERIERYFIYNQESKSYRIHKPIRDMLIFFCS